MTESFRGLKESLLQLGGLALDLPRLTPSHCEVSLARDRVADRLSLPDVPTPERQDELHRLFRAWLDNDGPEPAPSDWALSPFVYFRGQPRLCASSRFASAVAEQIRGERLPRMLKRAVYVYLRDYAPDDADVSTFGELIEGALAKHRGQWANDWSARAAPDRHLFRAQGLAARLAAEVFSEKLEPRALLRNLGVGTELTAFSGLHLPLAGALLAEAGRQLRAKSNHDAIPLQALLDFLREGDGLRFPALRVAIADELLSPFADEADPPDALRSLLTEFFDRLYGDPRNIPAAWEGVSEAARQVLLRWVVRKSLDLFFDVLSKTADPIWRYRKAFWLALYRRNLMEDAWPAFGRSAQRHVRRNANLRASIASFGELRGAQSEQSVMLMRMRGFTVAEWSHAGACRVWSATDSRAPKIGEANYLAAELRSDCLFTQNHTSAMSGGWQSEFAQWIAQRTGVRIPLTELMANTHA